MHKITIKTPEEIEIMAEGGKMLGEIRQKLAEKVAVGIKTIEIERLACELIDRTGGQAAFKMVPGYDYATCININDVVVHGIPDSTELKDGDVVGIDVGLYYKGFNTDAAVTVGVGKIDETTRKFLSTGKKGLEETIKKIKPGRKIIDLSEVMQTEVERAGYSAVRALTGHGVGKQLHEEPTIPCFVLGDKKYSPDIQTGMVLAIEIMYNLGSFDVAYKNDDGWTIGTADGKISGLFEESVAVTKNGYRILTQV